MARSCVAALALCGVGACAPGLVDGTIDGDAITVSSVRATLREEGTPNLLEVSLSEAPLDRDVLSPTELVDSWTVSLQVFAPAAGTFAVGLEVPGVIAGAERARSVSCAGDDFVLDDVQTILADDGSVTLDVDPEIGGVVSGHFALDLNGDEVTGRFQAAVVDDVDDVDVDDVDDAENLRRCADGGR